MVGFGPGFELCGKMATPCVETSTYKHTGIESSPHGRAPTVTRVLQQTFFV